MALFLGLLQGLTEFLPVSSSGHLILAQHIFEVPGDLLLFNIMLHLATLCAVCIVFRKKLWELIKQPLHPTNIAIGIATVITVGFVLLFRDWIDRVFNVRVLPITFIITAIVLFSCSFVGQKNQMPQGGGKKFWLLALITGLAQGLAVVPGISRSGATIAAGLAAGERREKAAEFSFLMSIPIIIAALVYELISNPTPSLGAPWPLVVGFVAALVSGIFAIRFMLHIIKRIPLYWFSGYLIVLAIITFFVVK